MSLVPRCEREVLVLLTQRLTDPAIAAQPVIALLLSRQSTSWLLATTRAIDGLAVKDGVA